MKEEIQTQVYDAYDPSTYERTNSFKQFNLPHNFTRHSFATYHLSLYFDPAKTSKITRNSEQMLRDHYWGALVEKDIAKQYFQILPNCKSKTENSWHSVLYSLVLIL